MNFSNIYRDCVFAIFFELDIIDILKFRIVSKDFSKKVDEFIDSYEDRCNINVIKKSRILDLFIKTKEYFVIIGDPYLVSDRFFTDFKVESYHFDDTPYDKRPDHHTSMFLYDTEEFIDCREIFVDYVLKNSSTLKIIIFYNVGNKNMGLTFYKLNLSNLRYLEFTDRFHFHKIIAPKISTNILRDNDRDFYDRYGCTNIITIY